MKLRLRVDVDGMHWSGGAIAEVPELYRETFEPLRTCDDPGLAYVTGEALAGTAVERKVMKTREDAAEILAKQLAIMIVAEMNKHDTHNGYRQEDER